jgi:hypothetical protein
MEPRQSPCVLGQGFHILSSGGKIRPVISFINRQKIPFPDRKKGRLPIGFAEMVKIKPDRQTTTLKYMGGWLVTCMDDPGSDQAT